MLPRLTDPMRPVPTGPNGTCGRLGIVPSIGRDASARSLHDRGGSARRCARRRLCHRVAARDVVSHTYCSGDGAAQLVTAAHKYTVAVKSTVSL